MSGPRSRNCYKLATQYNLAALRVARELRWARKDDARSLWDSRLEGVRTQLCILTCPYIYIVSC